MKQIKGPEHSQRKQSELTTKTDTSRKMPDLPVAYQQNIIYA